LHFIKIIFNFVEEKLKIMTKKVFPTVCPSCGGVLSVKSLHCSECQTAVSGEFEVHPLLRLTAEEQQFVTAFILCSGSLKQMAVDMGLSYPTVRNILDEIISKLQNYESSI
jgi:hypothetical protein